ncbi:hypothetical protein TIFTF001_047823 [Ficus carica]|nr:hypothetical protein TIFTF001_047823 [Ficus carica]
MFAYTI